MREPGLFGHVRERPVAIVLVNAVRRLLAFRKAFQAPAVDEEQVRPSVIIEVEECHAAAGGLEQILIGLLASVNRLVGNPRLARHVGESNAGRELGGAQPTRPDQRSARKRPNCAQESTPGPMSVFWCHQPSLWLLRRSTSAGTRFGPSLTHLPNLELG